MKSNVITNITKIVVPTCMLFLLTGCGYHLRTSKAWPSALRDVVIRVDHVPAEARINILSLLRAMHVRNTSSAAYTLSFSNYHFKQNIPSTISSSLPIQIRASASIQYEITRANGDVCMPPVTLISSYTQTEPANTVIVNNIDPDVKQRLLQSLSDSLYQHITSESTMQLLNSPACLSHSSQVTLKSLNKPTT